MPHGHSDCFAVMGRAVYLVHERRRDGFVRRTAEARRVTYELLDARES